MVYVKKGGCGREVCRLYESCLLAAIRRAAANQWKTVKEREVSLRDNVFEIILRNISLHGETEICKPEWLVPPARLELAPPGWRPGTTDLLGYGGICKFALRSASRVSYLLQHQFLLLALGCWSPPSHLFNIPRLRIGGGSLIHRNQSHHGSRIRYQSLS